MNKEEIEKAKEDLSFMNEGDYITKEMEHSADIIEEYIEELEQKETILDKVTDKLKEDIDKYNKELLKDSIMSIKNTDLTARILQSKKILNIIEERR